MGTCVELGVTAPAFFLGLSCKVTDSSWHLSFLLDVAVRGSLLEQHSQPAQPCSPGVGKTSSSLPTVPWVPHCFLHSGASLADITGPRIYSILAYNYKAFLWVAWDVIFWLFWSSGEFHSCTKLYLNAFRILLLLKLSLSPSVRAVQYLHRLPISSSIWLVKQQHAEHNMGQKICAVSAHVQGMLKILFSVIDMSIMYDKLLPQCTIISYKITIWLLIHNSCV